MADTKLGLLNGGTGASLTDPGADRLIFWDDSAGAVTWLTLGTGLSITGTTLNGSSIAFWAESQDTASPNNTIAVSVFTPLNGSFTHMDAAIIPKGANGSILAAIPDSTATGGNKRGVGSVDLQITRGTAAQVASGVNSVIPGGLSNTASGNYSFATNYQSSATASYSAAFGLQSIVSSLNEAGFVAGRGNTVGGFGQSSITGGYNSTITSSYSWIGAGLTNTVSGTYGAVPAGNNNTASGEASLAMGIYAAAYLYGMQAQSSGRFSALGDAQKGDLIWRRSITGTSITELFLDGTSVQAILASSNTSWTINVKVNATLKTVGNGAGAQGDMFAGEYLVAISRVGTSTTLKGTVQQIAVTGNMTASVVTITADNTTEALKIEFTPDGAFAGSTTVTQVVAHGSLVETRI